MGPAVDEAGPDPVLDAPTPLLQVLAQAEWRPAPGDLTGIRPDLVWESGWWREPTLYVPSRGGEDSLLVVKQSFLAGRATRRAASDEREATAPYWFHQTPSGGRSMNELFVPRVGGVLSADIAVPEHEREVRFYSRVLRTGENPLWREDLMNNLGLPIIGLGPRSPEYAELPLQWMPHIQVADVAASVRRALELGGREIMHQKDENGNSQWAVLLDPNGAAFGMIPVVPQEAIPSFPADGEAASGGGAAPGGAAAGAVGRIAWLDLTVPDAGATRDFYREVIGWTVQDIPMEDGGERYADYAMLGGDGKAAAGICHARGANADLPPVWLLYLTVGDIAESLRRVEAEGGKVIKKVKDRDGAYVYVAIQDPVGVYVGLVPG